MIQGTQGISGVLRKDKLDLGEPLLWSSLKLHAIYY